MVHFPRVGIHRSVIVRLAEVIRMMSTAVGSGNFRRWGAVPRGNYPCDKNTSCRAGLCISAHRIASCKFALQLHGCVDAVPIAMPLRASNACASLHRATILGGYSWNSFASTYPLGFIPVIYVMPMYNVDEVVFKAV
jgi:hypothetical protein